MEPQTFWVDGQTSHLASHTCLMLLLPYLAMPKRQIFCLKEKSNKAFPSSQPSFLQCVCSSSAPLLLTGFSVWFCFLSGPCWAESRRLMSLSLSRIRAMWSQWASLSASPAFKASEFGWIETPPEGFCIEAGTKKKGAATTTPDRLGIKWVRGMSMVLCGPGCYLKLYLGTVKSYCRDKNTHQKCSDKQQTRGVSQ